MKNIMITISCLVSILFSHNIQAMTVNTASSAVVTAPEELDQTCLDEYAIRNKFLKKFVFWAPPTLVVSLPVGSFAYFMSLYGLMLIAPYEALFYTGFGLYYVATPAIVATAVALEVKYSVEYFRNRSVVQVIDALRMSNFGHKKVRKFLKKFKKKYPASDLSNEEIFSELLSLDQSGQLCNGDLTGSNSDKIQKLLAKNKHIYRYLSNL